MSLVAKPASVEVRQDSAASQPRLESVQSTKIKKLKVWDQRVRSCELSHYFIAVISWGAVAKAVQGWADRSITNHSCFGIGTWSDKNRDLFK